ERAEGDDAMAAGESQAGTGERMVEPASERVRPGVSFGPLAPNEQLEHLSSESGEHGTHERQNAAPTAPARLRRIAPRWIAQYQRERYDGPRRQETGDTEHATEVAIVDCPTHEMTIGPAIERSRGSERADHEPNRECNSPYASLPHSLS